ncbi:MAG: phosphate acyltransferase PlsX [Pseudomonadota bacterium]
MRIAVDAMGGDHAPGVVIEGAMQALEESALSITLVGQEALLRQEIERLGGTAGRFTIENAAEVVAMDESPSDALKKKKDSSVRVAFELVRKGKADGAISAGNSGATLATAGFVLGRLQGVERPAIAGILPTLKGPTVMIDVGANVDCKPHHLLQFGIMGSVFSQGILGVLKPKVGLLSIGEEGGKGNQLVKKAHKLFSLSSLNFVGNVEGRDIFKGDIDVIVCDGFVGNISLKLSEGLAEAVGSMLRAEMEKTFLAKTGYMLSRKAFKKFARRVDYAEYGGAPLLGINGIGIIAHGRSCPRAIKNAILVAAELVSRKVNEHLIANLKDNEDLHALGKREILCSVHRQAE